MIYEVEQQYPQEGKLGRYALKQIERRFAIQLNQNEASGIAIHFRFLYKGIIINHNKNRANLH